MNDLAYATLEDIGNSVEENGIKTNLYQVLCSYRHDIEYSDVTGVQIQNMVRCIHLYGARPEIPDWGSRKNITGVHPASRDTSSFRPLTQEEFEEMMIRKDKNSK